MRASSVHRRAELGAGVAGDHAGAAPEDLRREDRGVARVVQADARDGHARGHLHDREDRVEAAGGGQAAGQRHADHRQVGVRGDGAGQRRGDAGAGDDHAQAAHARVLGVLGDRRRVRGGRTSPAPRAGCPAPRARARPSPSSPCRSWSPSRCPRAGRRRRCRRAAPAPPPPPSARAPARCPARRSVDPPARRDRPPARRGSPAPRRLAARRGSSASMPTPLRGWRRCRATLQRRDEVIDRDRRRASRSGRCRASPARARRAPSCPRRAPRRPR